MFLNSKRFAVVAVLFMVSSVFAQEVTVGLVYPAIARSARVQGIVTIDLTEPELPKAVISGPAILIDSCLKAVRGQHSLLAEKGFKTFRCEYKLIPEEDAKRPGTELVTVKFTVTEITITVISFPVPMNVNVSEVMSTN